MWDPRVGKTFVGVELAVRTYNQSGAVLIVAPKVVCPMWMRELRESGIDTEQIIPLYQVTMKTAREMLQRGANAVYVINWDKLSRLLGELLDVGFDAVIGDESHKAKGVSSAWGKAFRKLCWTAPVVRILTGTPTPNHWGDIWGQYSCLDSRSIEEGGFGRSYEKFARYFLVRDFYYKNKVLGAVEANLPELKRRVDALTSVVRREDVFGPDSYQEVVRRVELPQKASALYRTLAKKWVLQPSISNGGIDAAHVLKRFVKLQQLASGYLAYDDGSKEEVHAEKLNAVAADLIEIIESQQKVVIFHQFTREGDILGEMCNYSHCTTFDIRGKTSVAERDRVVKEFNACKGAAILIAQTDSAGIGISLAEATHAFFVSLSYSFAQHKQARDRIYKPGAVRCVTYYLAEHTIDEYIYKVVKGKADLDAAIKAGNLQEIVYG